jgi:hypothetical protein
MHTPKPVRKKIKHEAMKMVKEHKKSLTHYGKSNASAHHVKKHAKSIAKGKIGFYAGKKQHKA